MSNKSSKLTTQNQAQYVLFFFVTHDAEIVVQKSGHEQSSRWNGIEQLKYQHRSAEHCPKGRYLRIKKPWRYKCNAWAERPKLKYSLSH